MVLAFFPAAFSAACAAELRVLRDRLGRSGAQVLGIGVDAPFAMAAFARELDLGFPLLSDYSRRVLRAYDVAASDFAGMAGYTTARRALFVVDGAGRVAWRWVAERPDAEPDYGALEEALAAAG